MAHQKDALAKFQVALNNTKNPLVPKMFILEHQMVSSSATNPQFSGNG
jgi:hypothetical protein